MISYKKCDIISCICNYYSMYDKTNGTNFLDQVMALYPNYSRAYYLVSSGNNIINGTDNADNIAGSNDNDYILVRVGNDTLSGRNGNDILHGGTGNDVLYGEGGNDTYIFNLGDGQDKIDEQNMTTPADKVVFGEGITPDDITITRDASND